MKYCDDVNFLDRTRLSRDLFNQAYDCCWITLGALEENTLTIKTNLEKCLEYNFEVMPEYRPRWRAFYDNPYKGIPKAGIINLKKKKRKK